MTFRKFCFFHHELTKSLMIWYYLVLSIWIEREEGAISITHCLLHIKLSVKFF